MPAQKPMKELCEEMARKGDAGFAIAFALLDLSESQEATASALQRLGNGNASTHFGAIENLAMQVVQAAQIVGNNIESAGSALAFALENADFGADSQP